MYIDQTSILLIALIIAIGVSLLIADLLSTKKHLALREKDYKSLRKVHEKNDTTLRKQKQEALKQWIDEIEFLSPTDTYIQFLESGSKNSLTKWQKDIFKEALDDALNEEKLPEEHTFYSVNFTMLDYYDSYTPYKWFANIEEAKEAIATHNKEAFEIQKEFIKLDLPYKQGDLDHKEPHGYCEQLRKWQQASKTIALSMGKGEGLAYGHACELPAHMKDPYINEKTVKFTVEDMIENVLTDRN